MPKIIILVIAIDSVFYNEFKKIWKKYCHTYSNIKVFFLYNDDTERFGIVDKYAGLITYPSIKQNRDEFDLIYDEYHENQAPGVMLKTFKALEYINQKYNYDYVIRTNLTTFWNFNVLNDYLTKINLDNRKLYGRILISPNKLTPQAGVEYIAGYGMIMNKEATKKLLAEKRVIFNNLKIGDDKLMTLVFKNKLGGIENIDPNYVMDFNAQQKDSFLFLEETKSSLSDEDVKKIMIYRIKHSLRLYNYRKVDVDFHKYLCSRIYNVE